VLGAWVAEREGEVVAHVAISRLDLDALSALRWRESTGHVPADLIAVSRLFVRPSFRGQGIAGSLIEVACEEIRDRGKVPVYEVVTTSSLAPSYSRDHGWRLRSSEPLRDKHKELWIHRFEAGWTHHDD
jgi:predicted N-acetyltransferase YhbS